MHRPALAAVLPVHPFLLHPDGQPVQALGWLRSGSPIWPLRGGAPDDTETDDGDDKDDDTDDAGKGDDAEKLSDPGKQALERMKQQRDAAREALGLSRSELATLTANKITKDQPDEQAIRTQVTAELEALRTAERLADKIEVHAAKLFADPDDAAVLLMRDKKVNDFLDETGKVDGEEIKAALTELLEKKPHLAAQGGKRFTGDADGGRRKDAPAKATSLQDAVAKRMTAGGSTR